MKNIAKISVVALSTSLFLGLAVFGVVSIKVETRPQTASALITSGTTTCTQVTSPLRNMPGLNSITITEKTGINNTPTYNPTSSSLNFGTSDLNTTASEHYDFYYSDADGTANINGAYISSKMHRDLSMDNAQSGNNIDSMKLSFANGSSFYADLVASYQLGNSVSSVSNAALPEALGSPDGVVSTTGDQDSRITLGFCAAFPVVIECTTDSDCGTDSFIDNISCQSNNVYQNYKEYTCENPGTAQANCTDDTTLKVKQLCAAAQACNTGGCYPEVW